MNNDQAIIERMSLQLHETKAYLVKMQEGIESNGLSLDIDRIYDHFYEMQEWLDRCKQAANPEADEKTARIEGLRQTIKQSWKNSHPSPKMLEQIDNFYQRHQTDKEAS